MSSMFSAASDPVNVKVNINPILSIPMSVKRPERLVLLDARLGLKGPENHI
jgi:hypothetical protein